MHCLAGVSRSVTVTLAYLMHSRLLNFEEAFALVRLRKPDISPNFHFLRQLHAFERQLLDENPSRTVKITILNILCNFLLGSKICFNEIFFI